MKIPEWVRAELSRKPYQDAGMLDTPVWVLEQEVAWTTEYFRGFEFFRDATFAPLKAMYASIFMVTPRTTQAARDH